MLVQQLRDILDALPSDAPIHLVIRQDDIYATGANIQDRVVLRDDGIAEIWALD